jgi:hypothetical protein
MALRGVVVLVLSISMLLAVSAGGQVMQLERGEIAGFLGSSRDAVIARLGRPVSSGTKVEPAGSVDILRFRGMGFDRATSLTYDVEVTMRNGQVAEVFFLDDTTQRGQPGRPRR